jgi:hypothetical protein
MMKLLPLQSLAAFAALLLPAQAETVWFEATFDGGAIGLHGTVPDVTTGGATWVAAATFLANGAIQNLLPTGTWAGTATLAFPPENGRIYTLDASFGGITGDANWLALGFVKGQSTSTGTGGGASGTSNRFIEVETIGKAWMLARGNNVSNANSALLGSATSGTAGTANWSSGPTGGGAIDLRIVLNTTGGTGTWTATWFAKRPADGSYTEVRSAALLLNEDIDSVGIAKSNTGITGTITRFSLTSTEAPPDADSDGDGYADAWEITTFGTLIHGPADDPDGDGVSTADELTAGTDPADAFSSPGDADADGLRDADEIAFFGGLGQGPLDDFDGDGVSNHGELAAGTDPADPGDSPMVSFIPVTDGKVITDENGYAGSAINSIAFAQNNLITVGNQQVIAYYRRHATQAGHSANNTVIIGRRDLGETRWEMFPTTFTSYNINDTHNVISCAVDGDGFLHMSWGMHAHSLLYAKSDAPVTGSAPIRMLNLGTAGMTGQENGVTYPKFQTLPDGDVVFLFREGGSGDGDWFLNRYDTATGTWSPVHATGSGVQQPLMLGRGDSPDNCFYPDRLTLGPDGMLHLAGVFRYNSDSPAGETGYQTNHRYVYLRSPDGGATWQRSDGSVIAVPVVEAAWFQDLGSAHVPEIVEDLPEGHSIMNMSGMTTDSAGRPVIANWFSANARSGNHTRQYHIYFHNGSTWQRRTVSARTLDNPATKFSESQLGNSKMGRPVVLSDADNRIIVVYDDNRFDGITVVFSLPLAQDPDRLHWTRINLTAENLGSWEATYDEERWARDGVLQMLYQKLPGMGNDFSGQNNSTPVSVVEWNARAYFNNPVIWNVDTQSVPDHAAVSARTRSGFRYDLKTATDLDFSAPPAVSLPGDGTRLIFGTWPMTEARRFWRLERTEVATDDL